MEQSPGRAAYKPLRGTIRKKRRSRIAKRPERQSATSRPTRDTPATRKREEVAQRDKRTERVFAKKAEEKVPEYASLRRAQESLDPRTADRPYSTYRDKLEPTGITGGRTVEAGTRVAKQVRPPEVESENDKPRPMIRPGVGPVAQLTSQAAHTYGYTPEAYEELTQIPTTIRPPREGWEKEMEDVGAYYTPKSSSLDPLGSKQDSITYLDRGEGLDPGLLAHEQSHGWWFRNNMNNPRATRGFGDKFNEWAEQPVPRELLADGSTTEVMGTPRFVKQFVGEGSVLYPDESKRTPEYYAYTTQVTPNSDRSDWPDEIRPYYTGFLQGMDKLSTGEDTPAHNENAWLNPFWDR